MKLSKLVTVAVALGAIVVGGVVAHNGTVQVHAATVSGKTIAVGSTALQPLVEQAAKDFQTSHPQVNLSVQGGGSGTGLSQVQDGSVEIGNSDIFAAQQTGIKAGKLVDHKVAVVGMAPVVNKDVSVHSLTMKQLREVFTGKVTNWKQLGGANQTIVVVNRAAGSGTRATFENAVLKGATAIKTQEQDSNGAVQKVVESTPGAISYLAFAYVNHGLRAVNVNGVKPTAANVATNKWRIWSYEHMYTPKGKDNKAADAFIKYIQSKKVQNTLVKKLGYISISKMHVQMNAHNKVTKIR
ncbi:phosphate ABC transporter substrate-binding protein PstS family protein [Lacticaseibacillus thailandensis]|uniref:Phosphate-binding protein n=1 Tax=Lacticaseibacillus thailandensis DSM 22698 = JCM 13996 TaxID=1423810 RepID=A0A0R2C5Y8_9LACO|nr:phosphate ABC transporter substrate-binding protein PstS family protein [Lacticaseibacillus thailandensis]KRM86704.1 ABC-type phosphate transport system, periplasmic component [Lacticaseibacillus thailandensis DSM 22698 = JCM 13996]